MRYVCPAAVGLALLVLAPGQVFGQGTAGLSITNYRLVSEERFSKTHAFVTYQADLVNDGTARTAVTATVTSSTPAVGVVHGRDVLRFGPVTANGHVSSSGTFTLLIDRTHNFNLSNLAWSFNKPVANPGPNQTATLDKTVVLNAGGSTNPAGPETLAYHWQLESQPAGSHAQLANADSVVASFVVDQPGDYSVSLAVSNGAGGDKSTVFISTVNSPPVALAGRNQTVAARSTVMLDGSSSSDVDGDSLTYRWTLISRPAGSTASLNDPHSVAPEFVGDLAGKYIAQLVVNDGAGDSVPAIVEVAVGPSNNTAPVADAGIRQAVRQGARVQLNGAGSTDVDGDALAYRWNLISVPLGSNAAFDNSASVNPSFTADKPGVYVAQLIVNDGQSDGSPATVTVATDASQMPVPNAGPNQSVLPGAVVNLSGSGIDPQQLPLTYRWSLLSRPANSLATLSSASTPYPSFTADQPGNYVAQLVVANGIGESAPSTVTVTTDNTAPVADSGASQTVVPGAMVVLDGTHSWDANHHPLTYSWSVASRPPQSSATLQGAATASPSLLVDVEGTYVAQLIVNDGIVASAPQTMTITAASASIAITPNPLNISGTSGSLFITLPQAAPEGGLTLTLSSNNLAVAKVTPSIFMSESSASVGVRVDAISAGSAVITVSAPGLGSASATVNVAPPGSLTLGGSSAMVLSQMGNLTLTLSVPAPSEGLAVQLTSSDESKVAVLSPSVTVAPGATTATIPVDAVNVGSATITASAANYTTSVPLTVTVSATVIWLSQNVTITGTGQTASLTLHLTSQAPLDPNNPNPWSTGLPVNLKSDNPNVATIQPTGIFIWDSSTAPSISLPVTSVGPGTTVIHASGVNVPDATTTVTVVSTGGTLSILTTSLPGAIAGTAYSVALSASGGLTPYSWSATGLPSGLGIDAASGIISGTPTTAGSSTVSVTIADAFTPSHQSVSKQFTLTVASATALSITTGSLPAGMVGAAYSAPVTATGGITPYAWSASGLPAGLSIDASSGTISGTVGVAGSSTVTVTVTDASSPTHQTASKQFTLTTGTGMNIPTTSLPNATAGLAYTAAVTVSGGTQPYTWTATGLPAGLGIDATTGTISGVTSAIGTSTVTVTVTDSTTPVHQTASGHLSLTVTSAGSLSLNPNSLTMQPGDRSNLFVTLVTPAPAGGIALTLSSSNPAVASVVSSVAVAESSTSTGLRVIANSPGSAVITVSAPGLGSATASVTVTPPGSLSLSGSSAMVLSQMGNLTLTLSVPAPSGGLTVELTSSDSSKVAVLSPSVTVAAGATTATIPVDAVNVGSATITASAANYTTSSPFPVTVSATVIWLTQNVTITGTGKQAFLTLHLTSQAPLDPNNPNPWSTGLPVNLRSDNPNVATIQPTGVFIWDSSTAPSISLPVTSVGPGTTVIHASGVNVPDATTTVTVVSSGGTLAIVTGSLPGATAGTAYSVAMSASGGQTPYSWSATGLPSGLGIDAVSGIISGTPSGAGSSTVTVTLTDATTPSHQSVSKQFTLTVGSATALNITTGSLPAGSVGAAYTAAVTASGGITPYSWSASGLPGGLSIDASSGTISGTVGVAGSSTVTVTVTDASSPTHQTASRQFTLAIAAGVGITTTSLPNATAGSGYTAAVTAAGGTQPYTWTAAGLPAGLGIDAATGTISGVTSAIGTSTVTVTVTDFTSPAHQTASRQLSLTVASAGLLSLNPNSLTMQPGDRANLFVTLVTPAPAGGIALTLSSSNPAVASVVSSVVVSESSTSTGLRVIANSPGSAVITVSAPGLGSATASVTVTPPGSLSLSGSAAMVLSSTGNLTVTLSVPAPPGGLTVELASSDASKVAVLSPSVTVAAGATTATIPVDAVNVGSATITASAANYTTSAPLTVTVSATVIWLSQNVTITGTGQTATLTLHLTSQAPLDPNNPNPWSTGLPVNLKSDNPNVATIQPTGIFIWDSSTAPSISLPVTAVGPGTTVIHASGVNIPDATTTITVVVQ